MRKKRYDCGTFSKNLQSSKCKINLRIKNEECKWNFIQNLAKLIIYLITHIADRPGQLRSRKLSRLLTLTIKLNILKFVFDILTTDI